MIQPITTGPMMLPPPPYGYMQPQNNAVKIDIINPQAGMAQPANYYPAYAMPQVSAFDAANTPYAQPYCPIAQLPAPVLPQVTAPVIPVPPPVTAQAQIINAPQSVIPPMPPAPTQPIEVPAAPAQPVAEAKAEASAAPAVPVVEAPKQPEPGVDLTGILTNLNSSDLTVQAKAIENIAETAQNNPNEAVKLLDTQIMESFASVIKKDSTKLAGPTKEQIELRQKLLSGQKLTNEEIANASNISEMEMSERNKQYAIYTVAILQKLLASEFEKAQGSKLDLKDYPLVNDIVNVAKDNPNPMLRASALAALSYIAAKENKDLLKTAFEQSQKDSDPNVKAVATEALAKLSQV